MMTIVDQMTRDRVPARPFTPYTVPWHPALDGPSGAAAFPTLALPAPRESMGRDQVMKALFSQETHVIQSGICGSATFAITSPVAERNKLPYGP